MSKVTDNLRKLADFIDGSQLAYDFIKKDVKHRIPVYINEIRARAALIKDKDLFDSINLENLDAESVLKDRKNGRNTTSSKAGRGNQPWWYESYRNSRG